MFRKMVAVWVSLAMLLGFVVIVDVVTDLTPPVKAVTITVDDSGGAMFTKIQDAINASNPGDTVFVYNGTYYENIVINKTINLTGEDRNATIIDGGSLGNVVYVTSNWVNITYVNITGGGSEADDSAIKLYDVNNCTISNNTIYNTWYGINPLVAHENYFLYNYISRNYVGLHLWLSQENQVNNNYYIYNDCGIFLGHSINNHISSNSISNCLLGMNIAGNSNGNIIYGNNISFSDQGIYIFGSSKGVVIKENYISNSYVYGIRIRISSGTSIINNSIFWKGIYIEGDLLEHWNTHYIDITNSINNKPIYYLKNQTGVSVPSGAGQVIISNSTDIIIKDQDIKNCTVGIMVAFSSRCNITSTTVTGNQYGIYMFQSKQIQIENVSAFNNTWGMFLYFTNDNIVNDCNITSNGNYGLYLSWSNNNILSNNNATNNRFGLYLYYSDMNILYQNNLSYNMEGISLTDSKWNNVTDNSVWYNEFGIRVRAKYNRLDNNDIFHNDYGLRIESISSLNNVSGNTISLNVNYGIYLKDVSANYIYHNNIIDNNIQAYDDSDDNHWDYAYPSGGNFWSDYNGIDLNCTPNQDVPPSDGLGDTSYIIDADSQDNYPLMLPFTKSVFENYTILNQGWNLISIPLIQNNQDLLKVLEMIDSYYDAVQWYDRTDTVDPWKHNMVGKPFGNDLSHLNETMGFWIHITNPGDTIFLYNGTQPASNQSITLHPGWNVVGYPSLNNRTRYNALNNINYGSDVDSIWTFNASTQTWEEIGPTDYFELGRGYWIHSKVTKVWDVPL